MSARRVNLRAILSDPTLRRELMVATLRATHAREGIHTTQQHAEDTYDKIQRERGEQMAARRQEIRGWLEIGRTMGSSHVMVYCDTFDFEDYPVFVKPSETVADVQKQHKDRLVEVYDLSMDIEAQLAEYRAMHI